MIHNLISSLVAVHVALSNSTNGFVSHVV